MMIFVNILAAWLLADFLTGLIHWAQDRLLLKPTRFAFLNSVKADNDLHHLYPAAMIRCSWWGNLNTSAPYIWPVALVLFLAGAPTIFWLTLVFASFANLVHRWAHEPKGRLHPLIKAMQATGLFISFDHHAVHHFDENGVIAKEDTTVRYCPMTCWLNPVLDRLGFFTQLERVFLSNPK